MGDSSEFSNYLYNAIRILESIKKQQIDIREESKENYGLLLDAHLAALSVIGSCILRTNLKPGKTNESISGRLVLIASFIQGIDLCETAISEGLYAQAAALLKQELETLAAIEEFLAGNRRNGVTPNVRNLKWDLNKVYGALNNVAHVSHRESFEPLYQIKQLGEASPVSIDPVYKKDISRYLYALHVSIMIQISRLLLDLLREMYDEEPRELDKVSLVGAVKRLEEEGFISGENFKNT